MIEASRLYGQDVWVRGACPECGAEVSFVVRSAPHEYHPTAPCHVCRSPIQIGLLVQSALLPVRRDDLFICPSTFAETR